MLDSTKPQMVDSANLSLFFPNGGLILLTQTSKCWFIIFQSFFSPSQAPPGIDVRNRYSNIVPVVQDHRACIP